MALTSHRSPHPVRRAVGLIAVLVAVIVLIVATRRYHPLADRIEENVRIWQERSAGLHDEP